MKRILTWIVIMSLLLPACGKSDASGAASSFVVESIATSEDNTEAEIATATEETIDEDLKELEAIGDVDVQHGVFNVELTIPPQFAEEITDEDLNTNIKEKGFKTAKRNDDGSVTLVMSKAQHSEMMQEMSNSLRGSLDEMVGSVDYPNITKIDTNSNFTKYTITTKSTELTFTETFGVMAFYMFGGMYGVFNGTPVDNIEVTFINAESGEVIDSFNSRDLEESNGQ